MMYENLEALKKKSIPIYNLLRQMQLDKDDKFYFDQNKKQIDIFVRSENQEKIFLTSPDNRVLESQLIVDEILKDDYDELIVIGLASGTILNELTSRVSKDVKLNIIEYTNVIDILLRNSDLRKIDFSNIDNLALINENKSLENFLARLFEKSVNIKVFILPQYQRLFPEKMKAIEEIIKKIVKRKSVGINTNQSYQKRWIYNSIINLKHVLGTPKFLSASQYDFSNSIALIIGAGPSLNYELDLLEKISKKQKCYIFAIGSAYKALIKRNIKVDALFSYDPTPYNEDVLSEYFESKSTIPLCFGSSIGFESVRNMNYSNAFHLLTSQDYLSGYIFEGEEKNIVFDAPSVVVIAMQALVKIGFENIVFVGQNLGFVDEVNYAEGIDYDRLKGRTYHSDMKIKDVFGKDMYTNSGYKLTLNVIESFIKVHKKINYLNTTVDGAAIEGADFKSLSEIEIDNYLKPIEFESITIERNYNLNEAHERFNKILEERILFNELLNQGFEIIVSLREKYINKQIDDMSYVVKLEQTYNKMTKNMYFKVLISKLDRNYINIFESSVIEINREPDIYKKHKLLFEKMATLFNLFREDDKNVFELFNYISKFIKWE